MADVKELAEKIRHDNLLETQRMLEEVNDFLDSIKEPTFGHVKMRLKKHLQQDINWIAAMTGNVANIGRFETSDENPLLKNSSKKEVVHKIMGQPVGANRQPISKVATTPKRDEKAAFKNNVEGMYKAFLSLKDKDIIEILDKPKGETLVRGVAKLAGIKDWESCEVDVVLFADIREAIRTNALMKKSEEQVETSFQLETGEKLNENESEETFEEEETTSEEEETEEEKESEKPNLIG